MPHLPRHCATHHSSPLLLLPARPPSSLPRTRHLQPPRSPTLVKHKNIQPEHIQRVYLPRPKHRTNNAAPLPVPIPSNVQREETDGNNEILPTRRSVVQIMFTKCTGDLWARCTRYLTRCTPLPADLYAWVDVCLCLGRDGPKGHGGGGYGGFRRECGICLCLECRLGVEWGS